MTRSHHSFVFVALLAAPVAALAATNADLLGTWHSSDFLSEQSARKSAGWSLKFSSANRYEELIDAGYGVVEVWSGSYDLQNKVLYLQRDGSPNKTPYRVSFKSGLQLATMERNPTYAYQVQFARGEGTQPSLAKLPRWPSNVEQAARATRQLLSASELGEFAQTPKASLDEKYRYGLSIYLRNAFGVWRGNQALVDALQNGVKQPLTSDELPSVLLQSVWAQLQANPQTLQAAQEEPNQELASEDEAALQKQLEQEQSAAQAQTEQERAEQAKAEQARAEQAKADQAKADQAKADQYRKAQAEQDATEEAAHEQAPASSQSEQPSAPATPGAPRTEQQPACVPIANQASDVQSTQDSKAQTREPNQQGAPTLPPCPAPPDSASEPAPPKQSD